MKITYASTTKERLDKFLHQQLPDISRNQIQKHIKAGKVTINGKKVMVHHWLKAGDTINYIEIKIPATENVSANKLHEPVIIYQDTDYAIVEKPPGLLIHPTELHENATLSSWAQNVFPQISSVGDPKRPGIVHRLDKDVGGLVIIALNQKYFDLLKKQFQERKIIKKYYCLVYGIIIPDEGEIKTPLERQKKSGRMVAQSGKATGKDALTKYEVLKRFQHFTLLDVSLVTGRTHQIRAHLFSIGHSIVGDMLYRTKDIRKQVQSVELKQPFLYAYFLSLTDQFGEAQSFKSKLPQQLETFISHLKEL